MTRTSALDAAFLQLDSRTSAMHIASLAFFEGPVPKQADIRAAIERKLDRAPRCRQRLVDVPLALGRPVWVDDHDFDIARHVHRAAVPRPGGTAEVQDVAQRLLSEPLDHAAPLWEDWILEGLEGGRWALLTKVHHTMVDGIAGTDLLSTLLDTAAEPGWAPTAVWKPEPAPSTRQLITDAVRDGVALRLSELAHLPGQVRDTARSVLRHPGQAVGSLRSTADGVTGYLLNLRPTPRTTLIGPIGRDRGYAWTDVDLHRVLAVHDRLGSTVNDHVLAAVTSAFRDLLLARGEEPVPGSLRAMVPVSVRRPHERGHFDNRVSTLLVDLPVELDEPHDRLLEVAVRMRRLKDSHEAQVGEEVTIVADALPPLPVTAFLHLAFRLPHRNLTTVVTNVPGPTGTLYLAGRRMLATYPYVPIADRLRSGIAVTTYAGRLLFGVTTDRDSMPDAQALVDGIIRGFDDLAALAGLDPADGGHERRTGR